MLLARSPAATTGHNLLHSLRFELAFVLLLGVVLPSLTVGLGVLGLQGLGQLKSLFANPPLVNSVIGALGCAITLVLSIRRLRLYPGTAVARLIAPVLCGLYATFFIIIVVARIPYSNQFIATMFAATLISRYALESLRSRVKGLVYCLVPGGRAEIVKELVRTPVIQLNSPSIEALPPCAIIADLHADLEPEWERLLAQAAISGRPVYHYKQVWEAETGKVQIDHLSENSFGALVPSFIYQKLKRMIDLVFSVLIFPLALFLMAICAILIKLDDGGSIFFRQRRMGFRGKVFHVIKFRTMTETHDGGDRALSVTQSDDERITRVGRMLRRTRLDELPQIFNIFLGEMSWIGPRPEAVSLSTWYDKEIPFYRYRHIVRPGISGWAQVNQGHVASIDEVDDKLQYDFYYIKNLSYWLDIIVALRTIRVIFSGFGSR